MRGYVSVSERKYKELLEAKVRLELLCELLASKEYMPTEDMKRMLCIERKEETHE